MSAHLTWRPVTEDDHRGMRGVSPIRVLPGLALDVLGDPEREVGEETLCVWMEAGPGIDTLQPGGSSNMLILGSIMDLSVKGDGPMSHLSSDCKEGWGDSGEKVEAGRPPPHQKTDSVGPTPSLILVWIS